MGLVGYEMCLSIHYTNEVKQFKVLEYCLQMEDLSKNKVQIVEHVNFFLSVVVPSIHLVNKNGTQ